MFAMMPYRNSPAVALAERVLPSPNLAAGLPSRDFASVRGSKFGLHRFTPVNRLIASARGCRCGSIWAGGGMCAAQKANG
jgi:hypothetical protein